MRDEYRLDFCPLRRRRRIDILPRRAARDSHDTTRHDTVQGTARHDTTRLSAASGYFCGRFNSVILCARELGDSARVMQPRARQRDTLIDPAICRVPALLSRPCMYVRVCNIAGAEITRLLRASLFVGRALSRVRHVNTRYVGEFDAPEISRRPRHFANTIQRALAVEAHCE